MNSALKTRLGITEVSYAAAPAAAAPAAAAGMVWNIKLLKELNFSNISNQGNISDLFDMSNILNKYLIGPVWVVPADMILGFHIFISLHLSI